MDESAALRKGSCFFLFCASVTVSCGCGVYAPHAHSPMRKRWLPLTSPLVGLSRIRMPKREAKFERPNSGDSVRFAGNDYLPAGCYAACRCLLQGLSLDGCDGMSWYVRSVAVSVPKTGSMSDIFAALRHTIDKVCSVLDEDFLALRKKTRCR